MAKFELKSEDLKALEEKMKQLPNIAEGEINKVLHNEAAEQVPKTIQEFINVSKKKRGTHAKFANPFKTQKFNLGFFIVSKGGAANKKGSYGYLVFPDEGRGIRNPIAQDFTGRGTKKETPKVMDRLLEVLTKRIEEEL